MSSLLKVLLLLLWASIFGYAQNNNPFELQNRLNQTQGEVSDISKDEQVINPFEIKRDLGGSIDQVKGPLIRKSSGKIQRNRNIPIIVFILSLILIAAAVQSSRKLIPILYTALINENQSRILNKEFSKVTLFNVALYLIFALNLTLLCCYLFELILNISIWPYFVWLFIAIIGIYIFRHIIMRFLSSIFPFGAELKLYDFNISHTHIALSILIFISNLLLEYSNTGKIFLYVGIGLWILFCLQRVFKGILIGLRYRQMNLFHFFMYICAFELAPNLSLFHLAKTSFLGS